MGRTQTGKEPNYVDVCRICSRYLPLWPPLSPAYLLGLALAKYIDQALRLS